MLSAAMDEVKDKHKKQHNEGSKFSRLYTMSQWKSSLRTNSFVESFANVGTSPLDLVWYLLLGIC